MPCGRQESGGGAAAAPARYVVGVDVGSTVVKCHVYDRAAAVRGSGWRKVNPRRGRRRRRAEQRGPHSPGRERRARGQLEAAFASGAVAGGGRRWAGPTAAALPRALGAFDCGSPAPSAPRRGPGRRRVARAGRGSGLGTGSVRRHAPSLAFPGARASPEPCRSGTASRGPSDRPGGKETPSPVGSPAGIRRRCARPVTPSASSRPPFPAAFAVVAN